MSSDIGTFRSTLDQLSTVKAPGVSGSRIRKLVDFVGQNPALHHEIIKNLKEFTRQSPASHKLGTMYVIDAVARAYQDESKKQDNEPGFKAGLDEIRASMSGLVEDLAVRKQSSEQFEKMRKLIDIWSKAETFDEDWLNELRSTHFKEPYSTTPPGSPPSNWAGLPEAPSKPVQSVKPAPNADALFGILQNLAKSKPETPKSEVSSQSAKSDPTTLLQQLASQSSSMKSVSDSDPRIIALGCATPAYQRGREAANLNSHDRNRSRSPSRQGSPDIGQPRSRIGDATRNLETDPSLLPDRIRVYSRTLYVGAIPDRYEEKDVRRDLEEVAPIQSIVYNSERHHAFVKVHCRKDADKVRDGFEKMNRDGATVLRVKWGVGFGPRDCFDYYRGVSIIPVMRLTDADKKWSTSAEYGGTGGKPLEPGMVMEEPDIEIGAGNLGSKNMQRQRIMQQQQQLMLMGGMPMGMPGAMPGMMPNMSPMMPGGMPFPMMPGYPMMPAAGGDMQQFFAQMQEQMQQIQNQKSK